MIVEFGVALGAPPNVTVSVSRPPVGCENGRLDSELEVKLALNVAALVGVKLAAPTIA